jgi:hypothetical protein
MKKGRLCGAPVFRYSVMASTGQLSMQARHSVQSSLMV